MNIVIASHEMDKQIRALWELVFNEDSKEYLDFYFDVVMKKNTVITMFDHEVLVGMLHLNPYDVKGLKEGLYYVVGVATHPKYRRKGIMRELLMFAHKYASDKGKEVVLLPEDERFYKPFGYEFVSKQYNTTIKTKLYSSLIIAEGIIERDLDMKSFINWFVKNQYNEKQFEAIHSSNYLENLYKELTCEGGTVISINDNLVLYYLEDVLEVRKIYYTSEDQSDITQIASTLLKIAEGKDLVIHEVNERSLSLCFSYSRSNNYDYRPYMMQYKPKDYINKLYFDEVV